MRQRPVTLLAALTLATTPLAAQLGYQLGAGATIPMDPYSAYANVGWMALAGLSVAVPPSPLHIQIDALYGSNAHDVSGTTILYGGLASARYAVGGGGGSIKPYLIGGVGYLMQDSPGGGDGGAFAWGVGGGINFGLGPLHGFAEGRYINRDDTAFIPVFVGVRLGGN